LLQNKKTFIAEGFFIIIDQFNEEPDVFFGFSKILDIWYQVLLDLLIQN
jgi:hypothetical protein